MKKNTGCGCNDSHSHGCPPAPACDKVHSKTGDCTVEPFPALAEEERTVVLSDISLQALVEADIKLPDFAREIKHIRKNVSLTQCKAIPSFRFPSTQVKLFVEGIVHKNIQYVEDCSGVIKDYSVDVPFRCFHFVDLENPLFFPFGEFSQKGSVDERRELSKDGHGADRCTFGTLTWEVFTEPIGCKLLFAAVNELDILENFDNWGRFNKITEKMEVFLILKLSQKQQRDAVPPTLPPPANGVATAQSSNVYDSIRNIINR
ncbi:CsxC family protein [Metabacillus sp. Hm71]|uniref:CsxC family protein n=1 Tax=Metabacillus sp. Hm71 TaxID=3450743 RepID=UPI003F422EEB